MGFMIINCEYVGTSKKPIRNVLGSHTVATGENDENITRPFIVRDSNLVPS
jgi:hypothetical protein